MLMKTTVLMLFSILLSSQSKYATANEPEMHSLFEAPNKSVRVICLGDSVTGVYYHTGGRRAYSALVEIGLQRAFPETEIEVINAGISGHTTADGLNRLERDVLSKNPDLVTIKFSLNDMTRIPMANFESNLMSMIKQIQATGSAVVLCTPNSVIDSTGRPTKKLETYVAKIREVAKRENLPLADCYAAYEEKREQDEWAWTMMMSDDIHPNMGGHKLIAETIVNRISGQTISLQDVDPLTPTLPFTLAKLRTGEPVKILAMPPYDTLVKRVIQKDFPEAKLEVTTWTVDGLSLPEIEKSADQVRSSKADWVIIALPREVLPGKDAQELRSLSWILNKSLSFGHLEWDCIVISPDLTGPATTDEEHMREGILHQFVRHQDLNLLSLTTLSDSDVKNVKQKDATAFLQAWWQQELQQKP
ncbi:SGNH/GDSL hydrolase family protein [Polystyrenella longa]|nr:GDSL-type esterase/lipase family protein [Polystyrenella longa]